MKFGLIQPFGSMIDALVQEAFRSSMLCAGQLDIAAAI
jgi:hypothetical protein